MITFKEYVGQSSGMMKQKIKAIASVLSNIIYIPDNVTESRGLKAHANTERHWLSPDSALRSWLSQYGVKLRPNEVPQYADGGAGRCYFLGDKVVKMSANRVEANVAKMVAGRDDLPVAVIDVMYLGENIYAILQKWVDTKSILPEIQQAADFLTAVIDDHPEMAGFPTDKTEQTKLCREALVSHGGNESLLPYMLLMMDLLLKLYNATGFKHDDASPTNVGMMNNKIVFHDLGPNEDGAFDPLQSLATINKNRKSLGMNRHTAI